MDLHSIITLENLRQAFTKVSENKGCAGIDHVSTFSFADNGACYLSKKAKKLFIATLEQSFARTATYHHLAVQTDFRRIIDLQLLCFKRALQEPKHSFKPFIAK